MSYSVIHIDLLITLSDQKLHAHVESAVKHREPNIQKLAKTYNKLCVELNQLIQDGKAPEGAICPRTIDMDHLFDLDVDDEIWQDVGLEENDAMAPPRWMSDDAVRDGIKAVLELDRCKEEEERLVHERQALQVWFSEEWVITEKAIQTAHSLGR